MMDLTTGRLYEDGKHYDLKYQEYVDDIPFYVEQADRFGGPILEMFAGTGRITIPIAEAGHEITGVDLSPDMIAWGKEKAREAGVEIEWIQGDILDLHLDRKFNLVLIPFTSIAHMPEMKDIVTVFDRVKEHLAEDGTFIMDVFNPDPSFMVREPDERRVQAEYEDPDGRGHLTIEETLVYDKAAQVNRVKWHYMIEGEEWKVVDLDVRVFYPEELLLLLEHNGFEVVERYGYFDRSEFTSESKKQVMICRIKR